MGNGPIEHPYYNNVRSRDNPLEEGDFVSHFYSSADGGAEAEFTVSLTSDDVVVGEASDGSGGEFEIVGRGDADGGHAWLVVDTDALDHMMNHSDVVVAPERKVRREGRGGEGRGESSNNQLDNVVILTQKGEDVARSLEEYLLESRLATPGQIAEAKRMAQDRSTADLSIKMYYTQEWASATANIEATVRAPSS